MSTGLDSVSSKNVQPDVMVPTQSKIDCLPAELLNQIFSGLQGDDLKAVLCLSKSITRKMVAVHREGYPIKNFIQILINKLEAKKPSRQEELLNEILQNITPHEFPDLLLLKHIFSLKSKLIKAIETLDESEGNNLSDGVQPPYFFQDVFKLASFARQVKDANRMSVADKQRQLVGITLSLLKEGYFGRAKALVNSISDDHKRAYALAFVSDALLQAGDLERAIAVADLIPELTSQSSQDGGYPEWLALNQRTLTLEHISQALITASNFPGEVINLDKILPIAQMLQNVSKNTDGRALFRISELLAKAGNFDRAEEVANSILHNRHKDDAFVGIFNALKSVGNIDEAIRFILLISGERRRNYRLEQVCEELVRACNFDKAKEVANLIEDKNAKERALRAISNALVEAGYTDKASALAKLLSDENRSCKSV